MMISRTLGSEILKVAFENKPANVDELKQQKSGQLTIGEKVTELIGKIGEKIDVVAYNELVGEQVVSYIHAGKKLGVLVALEGTGGADRSEAGRDVAMQIAAMNPVAVSKEDVDSAIVERELKIGREQAIAEGKPEKIIDKIAEGKLNRFFKDNTLLSQSFVKDNSVTVAQYLDSVNKGLSVMKFIRISVA
jgi:elongation factor Ts